MPKQPIDEFAELLVRHVRDEAISGCDMHLKPSAETPVAKRWRASGIAAHDGPALRELIADCVDETVAALLLAIDQELLQLSFRAKNGQVLDLPKDGKGELTGWYMGSEGWIAEYSKERYVDDFADLSLDSD